MACISLLILLVRFKNRKATTRCLHRTLHFLTPWLGLFISIVSIVSSRRAFHSRATERLQETKALKRTYSSLLPLPTLL